MRYEFEERKQESMMLNKVLKDASLLIFSWNWVLGPLNDPSVSPFQSDGNALANGYWLFVHFENAIVMFVWIITCNFISVV